MSQLYTRCHGTARGGTGQFPRPLEPAAELPRPVTLPHATRRASKAHRGRYRRPTLAGVPHPDDLHDGCALWATEPCEAGCLTDLIVQADPDGRPRLMGVTGLRNHPDGPCQLIVAEHTPQVCREQRELLAALSRRMDEALSAQHWP